MSESRVVTKEDFVKFLTEKNLLDIFMKNLIEEGKVCTIEEAIELPGCMTDRVGYRGVVSTFIWSNTKEDFNFWDNIEDEWIVLYDSMVDDSDC